MVATIKDTRPPTSIKAPISVSTDLRQEYVAGGIWSPLWLNFIRSLPRYIDDITQDFGPDLYERMLLDSQVASSFNLIKLSVLSQGVQFVNPKKQQDSEWEDAETIRSFILRNVNRLERPFEDTLFELSDAMAVGYKIAEKTYTKGRNQDLGRLMIEKLGIKPRTSTGLLVDGYMNLKGIVGVTPKLGMTLQTSVLVDPAVLSIGQNAQIFPREKFMVFSHKMKDNDPRGTSLLRPAYNPWWLKTQVWPEYLKYLAQFAGASLIGYTSENAQPTIDQDSEGNFILDPTTGEPTQVTPEQIMLGTLLQFHNGTAAVFPFGSQVEPIEMQGNGEAFYNAMQLFDEQITKAILYQTLATGEGKFMARAASETHQDVLDIVIRFAKIALGHLVDTDFTYHLVLYNFGQYAADNLAPKCLLPSTEIQDFPANAAAVGTLMSVGYFADDQLPIVDAKLGLPERNIEQWSQMKNEERQAKLDQIKATTAKATEKAIGTPPDSQSKPARPKGGVAAGITDPDSRG